LDGNPTSVLDLIPNTAFQIKPIPHPAKPIGDPYYRTFHYFISRPLMMMMMMMMMMMIMMMMFFTELSTYF